MRDMIDGIEDGQAIAVRSSRRGYGTVVAGRVKLLDESRTWDLKIIPGSKWGWDRDDPTTITRSRLDDIDKGPPRAVRYGDRDSYNTLPGIYENDDGDYELIISAPVYNSKGVVYYAPDPYGTITDIESGNIADPGTLLPVDVTESGEEIQGADR